MDLARRKRRKAAYACLENLKKTIDYSNAMYQRELATNPKLRKSKQSLKSSSEVTEFNAVKEEEQSGMALEIKRAKQEKLIADIKDEVRD